MKRVIFILLVIIAAFTSCKQKERSGPKRPKLVIGLVVDQMRWDYLYRYYSRYGSNGFKRLLKGGYSCQNTMLNYIPSNTAPGHACIYTGSVPSIHGIAGNNWIDNMSGESVYCVDDTLVHQVGDKTNAPYMSPRNLLTTTITDELRLATNQRSRVYGIAIKDRGAILPAGHLANGAYWYNDKTGNFTTSTYYPNQSPPWLQAFNKRKLADSLAKLNWNLLYPANTYTQSTLDATNYEKGFRGEKTPSFPHVADTLSDSDRVSMIKSMPAGNTLTIEMAKACMEGEKLGKGDDVDFLAVSLSSTDYVGHQFAPNSMEIEDMYLRLDKELASFLEYLDKNIGRDNYLFFLTADHAGAHNAVFLEDLDIPAGFQYVGMVPEMNANLKATFKTDSLVKGIVNGQVFFDNGRLNKSGIEMQKISAAACAWLNKRPEISYVVDMENMAKTPVPERIRTMIVNGYNRLRSGSIQIILNPGWYDNGAKFTGMTHGAWNPYDSHIPLIWYGWHIRKGETHRTVDMTDISPTLAAMLSIQMPNGCIGKVIPELFEKREHHD